MTTTIGAKSAPAVGRLRLISACTIGNALEFYDFVIYSFFAATIGALFFPAQDPTVQLLLSFATYGVGFFLRPLGGMILGSYADRRGRKSATLLTLFLMAIGTGMIGLAPTYDQIGLFGPVMLVLGRLIQGFSAGGEIGASTTLLAEYAPPQERGFFGSWQMASQGAAVMLAAGLALTLNTSLSTEQLQSWGWRVPFLLGVMIVPVGLWLRRALKETHANETQPKTREVSSLGLALRSHLGKITLGTTLIIGGTAANAVVVLYMSTYAIRQLGMAPTTALMAGITAGCVTFLVSPIAGMLSDRLGRRTVIGVSYALLALLIWPGFLMLNAVPTVGTLLTVVVVLGALNAGGAAPVILTVAEIFPVEVRATGMSLVYALGVAVFGGFGQFIVTWLIAATGDPLAPAWYVIVCCVATLLALRKIPEMSGVRLT
ncbi:MFS transporter [Gemmobacter lanyuensis]|uniref:MFS transporter n=1 Tax=Gemmobacter lanyuensis TaxID=1054497 RepID=A0A918J2L6_9RHOB|nr:MFS transporter [Gemmobacter lanyuensis]GGW44258.1 MFS transporter [Gemmobacter lanyuensis]